ncbi:MAG: DUF732 domain-containing protein [Pseudonocardiaceae bacterium]
MASSQPQTVVLSPPPVAAPTTTAGPIDLGAAAYLDALKREGVPREDTATLLVAADSVCSRRGDTSESAQTDRLMTAFPGRWTPQQAVTTGDCASKLACG